MDETLAVFIPKALGEQLRRFCRRQNRSPDDVVCEALRRYIAAEDLRLIRESLRPYARAKGVLADDDVFKIVS